MNAVIAEKESSDVVEFRAPGPGERLRNARLALDMDINKMSSQLHLTADMVDALECDDYSELPARVFVRGYIRNYARVVELPIDSVLSQFDELWPDDDTKVHVESAPRLPADPSPGPNWARGVSWLLVLGGIVLFLMWWQGYLDRFTQTTATLPASLAAPDASSAVLSPLPASLPAEQLRLEESAQPVQGSGALALPAQPASAPSALPPVQFVAPVEVEAGSQLALPAQSAALPPPGPAAVAEPRVEASTQTDTAQSRISATQAVAPRGVVVSFAEDCWVDIRDSKRSFKLFGTMRKGTQRRLEGTPPYKLVLGNAAAVSIEVNGKPFDLATHTQDNVARFTLSL